jgi:predicted 3-demethylubiquinone-9 3-methyltransferase (glyoxalase superfamily)
MQKITTFLWFDGQAEDAVKFYVSIFKNAKRGPIARYGDAGPMPRGTVLTASFEIEGQEFVALNGGPQYHFTPAISFAVNCDTQEEIDELWEKLSADSGEKIQCGWLTDKYGVSWQIVPRTLGAMVQDANPERSNRVMQALMQMKKLDIAALKRAYEQR